MWSLRRCIGAALPLLPLLATALAAQQPSPQRPRNPLDVRGLGIVYDVPATRDVRVRRDVPYLRDARGTLAADIYLPPGMKAGERRPAVVFINAIGDRPGDRVKEWGIYQSWPRLVAAHGLVGISMDADGTRIAQSLGALFGFLAARGGEYGIDGSRVGLYAASANVGPTATYLASDSAAPGIRAAALYYGQPPQARLRADLPTMFIVAEGDVPGLRPRLDSMWTRIVDSAAAWTLVFAKGQPHAFDALSPDETAKRVIQQTLAFWRSNLEPVPAGPAMTPAREIVMAQYANRPARAAELLVRWVAERPSDTTAWQQLGRAYQQLRRVAEADTAFGRALALDSTNVFALAGLGQLRVSAQRWAEAERLLDEAARRGFENSMIRGQLGYAQLMLGKNAEGARSYERAFELGIPPGRATQGVAAYNLASAYARLGRRDEALAMLGRALDNGMTDRAQIEGDPDFAALRADEGFRALLARLGPPATQ